MEQNQENAPAPTEERLEKISLFWEDVTFRVPIKDPRILDEPHNFTVVNVDGKPQRTIVESLTGYAKPNELIGLLGPSGGGKTVLMNIFSSRLHAPSGAEYKRNVYVNNNIPLSREVFGKVAAYVMQDDVLLETLTPHECLQFAANLRLSGTPEEREEQVMKIIKDLRLTTCKDTLVGNVLKKGISGGERKRTSIGVELITDPSLIILDELTSGLDSYTAFTIVQVLQDIARRGRTIISIVQQPNSDIFALFDRIYLIAGGHQVYQGPTENIYDYFKMIGKEIPPYMNPADQLIKIMHAKEKPSEEDIQRQNELFDNYNKHLRDGIAQEIPNLVKEAPVLHEEQFKQFRSTTFGLQFQQLLVRATKNLLRNSTFTTVRIVQTLVLSVLLLLLYWRRTKDDYFDVRDRNSALFFICNCQFMLAFQCVLLTCKLAKCSLSPYRKRSLPSRTGKQDVWSLALLSHKSRRRSALPAADADTVHADYLLGHWVQKYGEGLFHSHGQHACARVLGQLPGGYVEQHVFGCADGVFDSAGDNDAANAFLRLHVQRRVHSEVAEVAPVHFPRSLRHGDLLARRVQRLSLIHICRCRRSTLCRSRWSP
eukprot:TRINITY_DN678_c0_g1_i8.p1 TRINITY_DN678_c0_g1~~TRINITY_DN678_c0_g1_i8.p1  ORF type:complete len:598 (+),score=123.39 TRINITY_DN678_c0_g1_i8:364-2157(+)